MRNGKSCMMFFRHGKTGKYDRPSFHPLMDEYLAHLAEIGDKTGLVDSLDLCRNALICYMHDQNHQLIGFTSWIAFTRFFTELWSNNPASFFIKASPSTRIMIASRATNVQYMGELGPPDIFTKETTEDDPMIYSGEPFIVM